MDPYQLCRAYVREQGRQSFLCHDQDLLRFLLVLLHSVQRLLSVLRLALHVRHPG